MKKARKTVFALIIASEVSHIFCCVLPTVFSVLSLLAGLGMVGIVPVWMTVFHEFMHSYEVPVIMASGLVLALGWGMDYLAGKMDCHDGGCVHGPCSPNKNKMHVLLKVATILFLVNVFVFAVFHRGMGIGMRHETGAAHGQNHDEHHQEHDDSDVDTHQ